MTASGPVDPFRVILAVVCEEENSDLLLRVAFQAGLSFDASVTGDASYSHKTRTRALMPRVDAAYEDLDEVAAMAAANAFVGAMGNYPELAEKVDTALRRVGWAIETGALIVVGADVREVFFPKGSQWDAFVVLRDIIASASKQVDVVDPYCDGALFGLLASRAEEPLTVRVLCDRYAQAVDAEAGKFRAQWAGWEFEIRKATGFHDRFVILDGAECYHIGASINGAGKNAFMISRLEDSRMRDALLREVTAAWDEGVAP